jgi:hypothetical protein
MHVPDAVRLMTALHGKGKEVGAMMDPLINFEFDALELARNYRKGVVLEFAPCLRDTVVEVGAGIGQFAGLISACPGVRRVIAVEPDADFCARHRERYPDHMVVQGIFSDLPADVKPATIVSINVLEHIDDDVRELESYCQCLASQKGMLCLLVPARKELHAPIDQMFGHFRRYERMELERKVKQAGFKIHKSFYFNGMGYLAWWFNFCFLKRRTFEPHKVALYDRWMFPWVHWFEFHGCRPFLGQSLVVIARAERS